MLLNPLALSWSSVKGCCVFKTRVKHFVYGFARFNPGARGVHGNGQLRSAPHAGLVLPLDAPVAAQEFLLVRAVPAEASCTDLCSAEAGVSHDAVQYRALDSRRILQSGTCITASAAGGKAHGSSTHARPECLTMPARASLHAWCSQLFQSRVAARQWSYACTSSCTNAVSISCRDPSRLWHITTCRSTRHRKLLTSPAANVASEKPHSERKSRRCTGLSDSGEVAGFTVHEQHMGRGEPSRIHELCKSGQSGASSNGVNVVRRTRVRSVI
jgi:hypothetical protein